MRAYFSVAPRFGVLVPWWLALPLFMLWGAAAAAFWLIYAMVMMVVIFVGAGQEIWAWWRQRRVDREDDASGTPDGRGLGGDATR